MLRRMSRELDVGRHLLKPHPAGDADAHGLVTEIAVQVTRFADGELCLRYELVGQVESLRLPEPRSPVRADGLWRHTCFEAFIAHAGAGEYWEYNFSPSGAWAAYHFNAYREGMAPLMTGAPPALRRKEGENHLGLEARLDLTWLTRPDSTGLRLGLAAIVEDRAQQLSYWALKHSGGKPDFHHADGFALELG